MAHTWTKIGELEELEAGGLIKADDFNEIHEEIRDSVNDFVDEVDEVIEDLEEADTALGTRMTAAEGNITSHGTRLTTAEGTITSHGSTLTSHGSTLTNHGSRLTTAESDIDTLETSVSTAQEDIEDLEDALDTVEARVDATEDDIETLETLVAANTTAITNEATRAGGVEGGLNTRLGTAESTITSHGTRIGTAENSITSLGTRLGTAEGTITSHTGTLTSHTNTLAGHTNDITNHGNRLQSAEQQITNLNTNKQNKLTAGENITIVNNVISATGGGSSDTELYWCTFGTTTAQEIQNALDAGKFPVMKKDDSIFVYNYQNTTSLYFSLVYGLQTSYITVNKSTNAYAITIRSIENSANRKTTITGNQTSITAYASTKAVYDFAQPRLTAGTGITIAGNVISATGGGGESKLLIGMPPADPTDPQTGEITYEQVSAAVQEGKLVVIIDPYTGTKLYTLGGYSQSKYLFYYTWHDGYNSYTYKGTLDGNNVWEVDYDIGIIMNENAANKAYSVTDSSFDEYDCYPNLRAVKQYAEPKHIDYSLLNTITFSGQTSKEITTTSQGVALNHTDMVITFENMLPSSTSRDSQLLVQLKDDSSEIIGEMLITDWKTARYMMLEVKRDGGIWKSIATQTNSSGGSPTNTTIGSQTRWALYKPSSTIKRIQITSNTSSIFINSGTVKVYGR